MAWFGASVLAGGVDGGERQPAAGARLLHRRGGKGRNRRKGNAVGSGIADILADTRASERRTGAFARIAGPTGRTGTRSGTRGRAPHGGNAGVHTGRLC